MSILPREDSLINVFSYEHAHGMLESAYVSIGTCARMAIAAGLDSEGFGQLPADSDYWLDQEERRSLWWAIMNCDRYVESRSEIIEPWVNSCRVINCVLEGRPLATRSPDTHDILPVEDLDDDTIDPQLLIPRHLASDTSAMGLGTFAREAQATYLLDQVLQITKIKELSLIHFAELSRLDTELQQFLSIVMQQCGGVWGIYCGAICGAITWVLFLFHPSQTFHIKHLTNSLTHSSALFTLHRKIISHSTTPSTDMSKQKSQNALDTITRVIIAVAYGFVENIPYFDIEILSPFVAHIARCAQQHASIAPSFRDGKWGSDLAILQTWLGYFDRRWILAG